MPNAVTLESDLTYARFR